jgi:hypothetical protein
VSNDNKILPFTGATPKVTPANPAPVVNERIVKALEDYLAKAKRGELTFVGIASVCPKGIAYSTWEPETKATPQILSAALGACSFLNSRFARACDEGAADGSTPTIA